MDIYTYNDQFDTIKYCEKAYNKIKKFRSSKRYNRYYDHDTFKADSVAEFLTILDAVSEPETLVYRGMQDYSWKLVPSIARFYDFVGSVEHKMIEELLLLRPYEFDGLKNSFDVIAKMQHYGLPTRLLDFTTNALVALYFSCEESPNDKINKTIGRVVCGKGHFRKSWICNFICDFHKHPQGTNFINALNDAGITLDGYYYNVFDDEPIYARPLQLNQRIINQSGVFMVFPNKIEDVYASFVANGADKYGPYGVLTYDDSVVNNYNIIKNYEDVLATHDSDVVDKINTIGGLIAQYNLSKQSLAKILNLYLNEDSHFYKLGEEQVLTLKHTLIDRFELLPYIAQLNANVIKRKFFSILIEPDSKKKILNELKRIGIDINFIYPELEYTTKKIKNKFMV